MTLERRAWVVARLLVILLMLITFRAAYWQLLRGPALQPVALDPSAAAREYARLRGDPPPQPGAVASLVELPQPVIQRTVQMLSTIDRGRIYDRDGNLLAEDRIAENNRRFRFYTDPSLTHVVGYTSALRTGINGLEASYNDDLLGLNRPDTQLDRLLHRTVQGSDLILTIDGDVQRAAAQALGGRAGAVVVLDADTGAVLAMTSAPTYDPNQILNQGYMSSLPTGALINRATGALYIPGSTWKTVALIAALDTRQITEQTIFDFGRPRVDSSGRTYFVYEVDGGIIPDPNHREDRLSLEMSFAYSANAAFAKIGDDMPPHVMIDYAQRFGFSTADYTRRFPLELPVSVPQLANDVDSIHTNNLLRAVTAIGQGELLSTPLNMALVVQAVVNDGAIPVPYLVESIQNPEGETLRREPNRRLVRGTMRPGTARLVKQMMVTVVTDGYGGAANVPGAVVGGKTGTAQVGGNQAPHAWFIGFAERDGKRVVISVMVENGGEGSQVAAPIFAQVAQVALQQE